MKLPVTQPRLIERKSDERNVRLLVNELRDLASLRAQVRVRTDTPGNGVYASIWSDTIANGQAFIVSALVIGLSASGGAWYVLDVGYRAHGGTLSIIGAESRAQGEDAPACDAKFATSGNTLILEVVDDGVNAMSWTAFVTASGVG